MSVATTVQTAPQSADRPQFIDCDIPIPRSPTARPFIPT